MYAMIFIYTFLNYLLILTVVAYHQNGYVIKHHRVEVIEVNRSYLHNVKSQLVPINRTARAFNVSFILLKDLMKPIMWSGQTYKFASNEYRLFPGAMNVDYCKIHKENIFETHDIIKYSNITFCPFKKGHYYVNNYRPDEHKWPPYFPSGDYKVALNITHDSHKLCEVHWFGAVKTIEKLRWISNKKFGTAIQNE